MKRTVIVAAMLLSCALSFAQSSEDFLAKYQRQVKMLGAAGVGVENIIDKWEQAFPEDGDMLEARFLYNYLKSQSTEVQARNQSKYLGNKPILVLKDSLDRDVYYYEETVFVDSLFARSQNALDKAISLYPDDLRYRLDKISSLCAYEKESPDLAYAELVKMIDRNTASHPAWKFKGEAISEDEFVDIVQEYCSSFFKIGTPNGYELFLAVSQKMNKLYPKNASFMGNIGSYWFVGKNNLKKAQSYYKKALKLDPNDMAANRNMKILEKKMAEGKK